MRAIFIILSLIFSIATAYAQEDETVRSYMTNSAILTNDMEKSLHFYTELMGYKVLSTSTIEDGKSKDILGIRQGTETSLTYLVPNNAEPNSYEGGLAIIEVGGNGQIAYSREDGSAVYGEIVMVHRVGNIDKIYKDMMAEGITIVTPLSPSATGRSMSFSALDPNGVRAEMYEIIPQGEE